MIATPLTRSTLRGVWPALITPWNDNDELDSARIVEEVRHYAQCGVNGVYTGGTTGEFYAQDDATFDQLTALTCHEGHAAGLPVQIGCTALSTRTACRRIRRAVSERADGIQIAIPFWLELKDDEVMDFFRAVVDSAGSVPVILYHTGRAKRKLSAALIGALAAGMPTLIGLKDTGCDLAALAAILAQTPDLCIFGAEHDLVVKTRAGGHGTYSSVTGLNARWVVSLYQACAAGDWAIAAKLQEPIERLMNQALIPMVREDGLMDSAVDRVQRIVGGGSVGLRCQGPYRSATSDHVRRLREWCANHAPELLQR
jgi:dihydrodipicolinate synthase/N-acetylneuraminate lyase